MRFRRIAVTGASGYLGRLLVNRLARCEGVERVLAIDIRPLMGDISQNVVYVKRDVTEPMADLLIKHRIEAVAHLAFVIQPDRNAARASRVNVGGASSVLDACAAAEVRHVLYMSSATVYGAHADNPPMLTEDAPLRPVRGFQYSELKVSVEGLLAEFAGQHPDIGVCILRACPVLGTGADNFVARSLGRRVLVAAAGYDPPMQFLLDDDAVEIMARCLLDGIAGTYNVGGGGKHSLERDGRDCAAKAGAVACAAALCSNGAFMEAAVAEQFAGGRARFHHASVDGQRREAGARAWVGGAAQFAGCVGGVCVLRRH